MEDNDERELNDQRELNDETSKFKPNGNNKHKDNQYTEVDTEQILSSMLLDSKSTREIEQNLPCYNEINISVSDIIIQGSGVNRYAQYNICGDDKNGHFNILRRFKEFHLLRQKLVMRWPGCFIPPIPNKTLMGNNEPQVINSRKRLLHDFLRRLTRYKPIYYGEQMVIFMSRECSPIDKQLQQLKEQNYQQVLMKYRNSFESLKSQELNSQQQKNVLVQIDKFHDQLSEWKLKINEYKNQTKKLAELHTKYNVMYHRVRTSLLPGYQQLLNDKGPEQEEPAEYCINGSQYQSKLQASLQLEDQCADWLLFNIFKSEVRDIDALIQCCQQCKRVKRQLKYFQRNIEANKEHIECLNTNKNSLKIFFMSGSDDEKKTKLSNENEEMNAQMEKIEELLSYVVLINQNMIKEFHQNKYSAYRKYLLRFCYNEVEMVRKAMQFHAYEWQYLSKVAQAK